ncbi:MAG: SPOR domain-containing protein [Candidatus Omnitrophica bacterium]|nr:SPOR domain-containing protein [Candidatus Omnitrophota bacterium]MDE2223365.1 SPOR domain-containing protein [Candidatus Omnitrophota bacterium]
MHKKRCLTAWCLAFVVASAGRGYAAIPDIQAAIMNKDYAGAREQSVQIMKDSNDPAQRLEAQYYYGLAQLRLGQYADARSAFQSVMNAHPAQDSYDRAALSLTEGFYMAGLYSDALQTATELLRKSPNSSFLSLIYFKIAGADLKLMRWEDANTYLNKIVTDFPKSPEAPIARQLLNEKQYFAVQVGSFLDKGRALTLIDDLKGNGQYAYVVETTASDGQTYYRVRVGQMSSLNDAEDLKKRLEKLGYPTLIYP